MSHSLTEFSPDYYLGFYKDLRDAYGVKNWDAAWKHYKKYGYHEGRSPNLAFAPSFYVNRHADLKKAFGKDWEKASDHWVKYGINEGRQGSIAFSPSFYLQRYSDLKKAFGPRGFDRAYNHYIEFGIKEKRFGSPEAEAQKDNPPIKLSTDTSTPTPGVTTSALTIPGAVTNVVIYIDRLAGWQKWVLKKALAPTDLGDGTMDKWTKDHQIKIDIKGGSIFPPGAIDGLKSHRNVASVERRPTSSR